MIGLRLPTLALLAWLATPAIAAPRNFGVQDLVRLDRISELAVAPDGRRVAYTLRSTDMDANNGRTGIFLYDPDKTDQDPTRLSDLAANGTSAAWSANGRYVYYLSNRGGSNQVWRSDPQRNEVLQVTHLPLDVGSFRLSPTGNRLLVSLEVYRDCGDLTCTRQRLDAAAKSPAHGVLYDTLFARHWDTWSDGRRSQLFGVALDASGLASGRPVNLSGNFDGDVPGKPFGGTEDYAFSADGRQVVFSMRVVPTGEPWSTNFDVFEVPAEGGTPKDLTSDNPAWDGQPAFSPDGKTLAYVATDRPGFESDRFHLVLLDLKTGGKRTLTPRWDRSVANFAWAPNGKTLYATADDLGQRPLWAIDAKSGETRALTGEGEVETFATGPRQLYFTHSDLKHPANLFMSGFTGGTPRQLTHLNDALLAERQLGDYEQFSFAGWNGEKVYGYRVTPPGFDKQRKYPVALVVHGGPQGSMGNIWHYRWNAQTFAAAGYVVLMIDFHGSTGYGQAFTDSIRGDWGGKPLEDLKLGLAAALERYPYADGNRACALGGSYGGYMMNWIAGQWPDRFKCIVTHDGIFDNRSMYYSTEELWFPEWENGGPEYANPAGYARHNPVDYVNRWTTPTLVIHGQLDYRVPYAQGLAVYTALQRRGVPSEFLYFPDENHWVLKPANTIQWYDTALGWMNRWTQP